MALLPQQYAKVLYELTVDKKGKALDIAIEEFASFLRKEQVISKLPHILDAFEQYTKKQEGIVSIDITSARTLTDAQRKNIVRKFGKKVEVTEQVDEQILGGVVVRSENTILDGSIKTQLHNLKSTLA